MPVRITETTPRYVDYLVSCSDCGWEVRVKDDRDFAERLVRDHVLNCYEGIVGKDEDESHQQ